MVICGKNASVRAKLLSIDWPSNVAVVVLGFVPEISVYMAAADLLVTKAGPGTIAEACSYGVPMVLSSYLPGQVTLSGSSDIASFILFTCEFRHHGFRNHA